MIRGWVWDWLELQAGKGGDADVALLTMVEGAGREGSGAAEAWRGVRHSPGAVEDLRIDKMALLSVCKCFGQRRHIVNKPS